MYSKILDNPDEAKNSIQELVDLSNSNSTTITGITDRIAANEDNIETLQSDLDTAELAIDSLEEKVGEDTVSDQIDAKITSLDLPNTYEAKGAADAVKTELLNGAIKDNADAISDNADAIETLNADASTEGSVDYKINNAAIKTTQLVNPENGYIIFDCGSSTEVV